MKHMTFSWLHKYANVNKRASYQDKLAAVFREKNAYYLLEWLLFPASVEEAEMIRFNRSPSMVKNSYIDFTDVFFDQIVYEIGFRVYSSERLDSLLLNTAIYDLRVFYGKETWEGAVRRWNENMQLMWVQYENFEQQLDHEQNLINKRYQEQLNEVNELYADDNEEKKFQLRDAQELYEQRKDDAPRKLLQKQFKQWPLVSYLHYSEWKQPKQHWLWLKERMLAAERIRFLDYVENEDYSIIMEFIYADEDVRKLFIQWFPAFASKMLMTVEYLDIESRQNWWIGLLRHLNEIRDQDKEAAAIWKITFALRGIDEVMMREQSVPSYFNRLVTIALKDEGHRRWLREVVILRYWEPFIREFAAESYQYEALSWLLCLDPTSLEQKLLRGLQQTKDQSLRHVDLSFIVERCCQIFSDGIREGLDSDMMVPLFTYLTIHHIDFLYSYIQTIQHPSQLLPILGMDNAYVQRIFSGKGVRAEAARKHLQPIFLTWLAQNHHSTMERTQLKRFGQLYLADKRDLLQDWLNQAVANIKEWPHEQAAQLEDMLQIQWLGQPDSTKDQHEQVQAWLDHNSDWVKFELDAQASNRRTVKYRIIRPGCKDRMTGHILARVWVRAEWTDPNEILSLLDDLKNL